MIGTKAKSLLFWIISVFSIISLASAISNYGIQYSIEKKVFRQDWMYKLLGESRRIFSRVCMMRADEYFHGGVTLAAQNSRGGANEMERDPDKDKELEHELEHILEDETQGHQPHEHDEVSAFKQVEAIKGVAQWNILLYLGELINIDKHMHLKEEEQKELVPWYIFATELDPHNIHAYVIGGYWIGKVLNSPDEGLAFLYAGLRQNPESWKLYRSIAEIFLEQKKDFQQALMYFRKAENLFTAENVTRHESWQVYMYIGACHEHLGHWKEALITYQNILKYFPGDKVCQMKVKELSPKVNQK